jgi:hypothetical protein
MIASAFKPRLVPRLWQWFATGTAILLMVWTTLYSATRPLVGPETIWSSDNIRNQTIYHKEYEPLLRMVENLVPADAELGLILEQGEWEFPLFGNHFSRKLFPICISIQFCYSAETIEPLVVARQSPDFLLLQGNLQDKQPLGFHILAKRGNYQLLYRAADFSAWHPDLRHSLLNNSQTGPQNAPLISTQQALRGSVGVDLSIAPSLTIEFDGINSFVWLGQGNQAGLTLTCWSDKLQSAVIRLDVTAGPSRSDNRRTVQLIGQFNGKKHIQTERFTNNTTLWFPIQLQPGRNDFELIALDEPNVQLPRQLLVSVHRIIIDNEFSVSTPSTSHLPVIEIEPSLGNLQVSIKSNAPRTEEVTNGRRFLWLGHGTPEGATLILSASQEQNVVVGLDLAPGASRSDNLRTLTLTNDRTGERITGQFDRITRLWIPMSLKAGQTVLRLAISETANKLIPNDSRTLLAAINRISVFSPFDIWQAGPHDAPFITVAASLWGIVGVEPDLSTMNTIETDTIGSHLSLRRGQQGQRFTLWAVRATKIVVELDVEPLISGSKPTMNLTTHNKEFAVSFTTPTRLRFPVDLAEGRNDFVFEMKDSETSSASEEATTLTVKGIQISNISTLDAAGPLNMPLVVISESLRGSVGVDARPTAPWNFEHFQSKSFFWLGNGSEEGLSLSLWSEKQQTVTLLLSVEPGPGRQDTQRTLQIITASDRRLVGSQQFQKPGNLEITLPLQSGQNDFVIAALEPATVWLQGDPRALIQGGSNSPQLAAKLCIKRTIPRSLLRVCFINQVKRHPDQITARVVPCTRMSFMHFFCLYRLYPCVIW